MKHCNYNHLAIAGAIGGILAVILTGLWLWPYNLLIAVASLVASATAIKHTSQRKNIARAGLISSITAITLFAAILITFILIK
jgi:hypothetical protein